ncbi:related to YTH1 Protein of the 3` processing complex [Fusarium proliferatum ET1]|uniref:Related to YTH1 Protein of the 3` processing complex n=1 Tax=Fusarium proliferatum (strain ET1) TaxID=1227346 RepID=A0A1L7V1F4_FUSPR|nr:related to YTH1 Protein of the 3` processing complex [Fusarium proliferatum ET1]CVK95260.1 related to YTH1 Protein of the 3` processing complex [Fusarium proliferatum]CZR34768.1 related to YTH1 Protein of the 3` processing complex [Fusarium proliferatum ET1]
MSEEERELLARISQVAGQINRHKNQQAGSRGSPSLHPAHHRQNSYRHASSPYPARHNRIGRHPTAHHHRTLHLNGDNSAASRSASSGAETPPGWVSRTDRHRQLINANVYEKETQNRAKAIEETRQRKINGRRQREKAQFNEFLKHQATTSSAQTNPADRNVLTIDGVQFRVMDGGKKLVKIPDALNSSSRTPKFATVAGVKFYRTKTGNLVANRFVNDQRRTGTVKKINQLCKIFSTTGSCTKGPRCRYIHDPNKVALCKDMLKDGQCVNGESCDLSHDMTPERTPNCLHFAKGHCAKADCPYTHSKASPGAPVCRNFGFNGYCEIGAECTDRHVFECPDFSNTGRCKVKGCKLPHRERASVLRNKTNAAGEPLGDISSDDEAADSDDVDSDEVAEFIDADSDLSDFEEQKDFISI